MKRDDEFFEDFDRDMKSMRKTMLGARVVAVVLVVLNLVFWLALAAGVVLILKIAGVL